MADLITGLEKAGTRVILATFSNPYIAQDLPPVPAYLIAWGGSPLMQRAAARALLGVTAITGQLPITIPSVAPYGAGLRREARAQSASSAAPATP
jgi:beta-N-acetylhexosaminidase